MEFALVLFIFPFVVFIASIIGFFITKRWYVLPILTFAIFIILTFTIFNISFFIWVVTYTILSLIVSAIMNLLIVVAKERK